MISFEQAKTNFLKDENDVCEKYVAMMTLRTYATEEAAAALMEGYPKLGESEMLRHDVMYAMGQIHAKNSLKFLLERMNDPKEKGIVRHEAGEALSNYHSERDQIIPEMQKHWDSEDDLLRSTVRIAINKLKDWNEKSRYGTKYMGTIEPAEPFNEAELRQYIVSLGMEDPKDREHLYTTIEQILLKPYTEVDEYKKYRICYFLRDTNDLRSKEILCKLMKAEHRDVVSPLLRHELCFIFGQIMNGEQCIKDTLKESSLDVTEHPVVRHEAILAFYELTDDEEFVNQFLNHENQLIRESVLIAIEIGEDH